MYKVYCRIYQATYRLLSSFLPWRKPQLLEGEGSLLKLPDTIKQQGIDSVLIVTDAVIASLGLMDVLLDGLKKRDIAYIIYNETVPNPTINNIEQALKLYHANHCQGIIAFGGGSPMDCAKGVGARVARPNKTIPKMKGQLKVLCKMPPFFAIPTTSGTGSEVTVAAVITDSRTHLKYAINDPALIPHYAVLDPTLTLKLPKHITSTTGMDALTHAVEAYIGGSNTKETRSCAREAVKLVFRHLYNAYDNGMNIIARAHMQKAAYFGGIAFTRAYVGYVHAMAHALGGIYGTPHGLANAVILPYVLDAFGASAHKPLAELADVAGIADPTDSEATKAQKFIEAIRDLNRRMAIPERIEGIKASDIPLLAKRATKEGNPLYPVPEIWGEEQFINLFNKVKA